MMDTMVDATQRSAAGRRQWSEAAKRRIVAETLEPGASVSVVARRHDVNANLVFTWRRQYREGLLREAAGATAMIPVQVASATCAAPPASAPARPGVVEIELPGGIKLRVRGRVEAEALREILAVLPRR
jgi:transposase